MASASVVAVLRLFTHKPLRLRRTGRTRDAITSMEIENIATVDPVADRIVRAGTDMNVVESAAHTAVGEGGVLVVAMADVDTATAPSRDEADTLALTSDSKPTLRRRRPRRR